MATGIYRTGSADRMESAAEKKAKEEAALRAALSKVNWDGLAAMAKANTPVAGGRGTAVNTVGQPGGFRPGTNPNYQGPQLRPGQGGINEIGSGGRPIGSFPAGIIGDALKSVYEPTPTTPDTKTEDKPSSGSGNGSTGGGSGSGGGGGGGGGGGSRGGGGGSGSNLWDDLLKQFDELLAQEQERITGAGDTLMAALQGVDPMAQFQWNTANIGVPRGTMDKYFQAQGWDTGEIDTTQQLQQDLLNAFLGDVGQVSQGATTAADNWRQRQQDVAAQLTAEATRQLALNAMAAKMGIRQTKTAEERALENQALQLALEYGKMNSKGTVTAPTLPFQTVTLPGYGTITLPSTLG